MKKIGRGEDIGWIRRVVVRGVSINAWGASFPGVADGIVGLIRTCVFRYMVMVMECHRRW